MRPARVGNALQNSALRHRLLTQPRARQIPTRLYSSLKNTHPSPSITPFTPRAILRGPATATNIHRAAYSSQDASSTEPEPQLTSFEDSSRPGLFYHLVSPPTPSSRDRPAYALSFLEIPPPHGASSVIIGWLPATRSADCSEARGAGLSDFVENRKFRDILQEVIKDGLQKGVDEIQSNGALQLQAGWMHIHDDRNLPPLGRIGDPDDIIGTVLVEDSKILPETYMEMPSYRLCTDDGPIKLSPGLAKHLQARLEEVDKEERSR